MVSLVSNFDASFLASLKLMFIKGIAPFTDCGSPVFLFLEML